MRFTTLCAAGAALLTAGLLRAAPAPDRPTVELAASPTVITQSCRVVIPPGKVFADPENQGVIQIGAPNVEIEFTAGSVLRGAPSDARPDTYEGCGIRVNGQRGVTLRGARISGFRCGVWATKADGLTLEAIDASDNRRAFLRSTPIAEDGADWLFPHNNDENPWRKQYGGALCLEDSANVIVRDCRVWHGQNALVLVRVQDAEVYDNDFSFNSGWGVALWRSNRNVISRNAIDFCVRGYSHGVYNRGQDSAGILMFEQNCGNVIAENSATHGGDCFFGFAGREAIGEAGQHPAEWYKRRGNNDNLLVGNDLSYAPAHGIEMTFSFGNQFIGNRLVGNAICGVWGGYSQDTLIAGNRFEANGEMGYGLERGGVNIEHGRGNRVVQNTFTNDKCGVHYWARANAPLAAKPWGQANGGCLSTDNLIAGNIFTNVAQVFHFRGVGDARLGPNTLENPGKELTAEDTYKVASDVKVTLQPYSTPKYQAYGKTRPVGARPELRGRQAIIMTEWGPWDHASPLVRALPGSGAAIVYELHQMPAPPQVTVEGDVTGTLTAGEGGAPARYEVKARQPGAQPYTLTIAAGDFRQRLSGMLLATTWDATFFKWPKEIDPREKLDDWRKLAAGPGAVRATLPQLTLKLGYGGPSALNLSKEVTDAKLGGDHYGLIARAKLPLTKGKWRFKTVSDDGVRVAVDGKPVIENWAWHGPTTDTGTLDLPADRTVEITLEYFQIDGFATLEFELTPGK